MGRDETRTTSPGAGGGCRNCGRPTGPRFCGHCGQPVDDRRRPLLQVTGEVLSDLLSLDGRLVRSLRALFRPGKLTRLYREGKRAPYLRPLRLYLLASMALFSTVLDLDPPDAAQVDLYIGGEVISAATAEGPKRSVQILSPDSIFERLLRSRGADRLQQFRQLPPQQILDSLFDSLRRYLPACLVLFVPFLAAALKLLYLRSGTLYLDHLVFSLHFQSALFFALATSWLLGRILGLSLLPSVALYVLTGVLMMTVYLGRALARSQRQKWWWTTLKTASLTLIYAKLLSYSVGLAATAAIWRS